MARLFISSTEKSENSDVRNGKLIVYTKGNDLMTKVLRLHIFLNITASAIKNLSQNINKNFFIFIIKQLSQMLNHLFAITAIFVDHFKKQSKKRSISFHHRNYFLHYMLYETKLSQNLLFLRSICVKIVRKIRNPAIVRH